MRDLLRDPDVMRDVLRRRLLRGACSAVSFLTAATRGNVSRVSDDQFRAATLLARLAPVLVGEPIAPKNQFDDPQWWTPKKIIQWEALSLSRHDLTPQYCADLWGACFRKTGAHPPHFNTYTEALAYGRRRAERHQSDARERIDTNSELEAFEREELEQ